MNSRINFMRVLLSRHMKFETAEAAQWALT